MKITDKLRPQVMAVIIAVVVIILASMKWDVGSTVPVGSAITGLLLLAQKIIDSQRDEKE